MEDNKKFADGFSFKRSEKAPDFVVGKLNIKIEEGIQFLKDNQNNGWVNLDIKQAKSGKYYIELDTYKATSEKAAENGKKTLPDAKLAETMEKVKSGKVTVSVVQDYYDLTTEQYAKLKSVEPLNIEDDELPF
jgi:hypothetical protein